MCHNCQIAQDQQNLTLESFYASVGDLPTLFTKIKNAREKFLRLVCV